MRHPILKFYHRSSKFLWNKIYPLFVVFSSFNLQSNSLLLLNDFLNSVGQLKYRGTSVLFRLPATTQELLRMSKSVFLMKLIGFYK
jgi:hypothetical protein